MILCTERERQGSLGGERNKLEVSNKRNGEVAMWETEGVSSETRSPRKVPEKEEVEWGDED